MNEHANNLRRLPAVEGEPDTPLGDLQTTRGLGRVEPNKWQRLVSRSLLEGALVLFALLLAMLTPPGDVNGQRHALAWGVLYAALVVLFGLLLRSRRLIRLDLFSDVRNVLFATSVAAMTTLGVRVVLGDNPAADEQVFTLWAFTTILLVPGTLALSSLELRDRRAGIVAKPTLIVGAGRVGQLTAKRLLDRPELGLRPVGFIDKNPLVPDGSSGIPVLGASWDLDEILLQYDVRHVIFAYSTAPHEVLLRMVRRCQELGIAVSVVPRLFEKVTAKVSVDHIGGLPLISIHPADPKGWQIRLKYQIERVAAAVLLVFLAPLLAVSVAAVWLSVGRPILFRQRRVGLDGQEFGILKFRSMKDAPADEEPLSLLPDTAPGGAGNVERRTRVGKLLRRTSIDELPQLINVVRGEMSLIGPRPERPEFAQIFYHQVHRYDERLRVKSGITGWAQVHGLRGQTSLSERVELDNHYIDNWSFRLDARILLMTVRSVLRFDAD
jgi:exopolysaccharide biosynthesis polyprenyl glycosylphosphotransferase